MSARAYEAGLAGFHKYFDEDVASKPEGTVFRAGGRVSKKYPNKEDASWWKAKGPEFIHNWYNFRMTNPHLDIWTAPDGTPAIELQVAAKIPGDVILKGYIDRVMVDTNTGKTIIIDLKTGQAPKSGLQLAIYRLAMLEQYGEAPEYGSYWMARTGVLDTIYELEDYSPKMVARWLRDAKKSIDLNIFIPNTNNWCDYCEVKDMCYTRGNKQFAPTFDADLTEGATQ
jgi:putative RecB family exonuclease|tara:strand:- start:59 stop:739 length:681 start_codon:yes stop_codon:yes gene_type:complete